MCNLIKLNYLEIIIENVNSYSCQQHMTEVYCKWIEDIPEKNKIAVLFLEQLVILSFVSNLCVIRATKR